MVIVFWNWSVTIGFSLMQLTKYARNISSFEHVFLSYVREKYFFVSLNQSYFRRVDLGKINNVNGS
ncbi:MAG: hypothetical protein Hyperionvirus34_15 [Hyperionvirus sp.]|uniref:Uncharacterized protein n=1 Tax=Hyperionvirus sp. TaxID=2487770 RepID=A0A3G5AEJ1_9VIRU|nr:MAG: hypothetical protein Hyperionvirus34_15 [Hyperionvirus sp.]